MCSGYTYEYTSSEKVCPSGYTYDGDACARDCYRGSTTCSYTYPTYICPSGWTNGYICSRQVYTTTPLEYQGCDSGDSESGDGTCYSSYQVGSVSYTCPSGWNKSGTTCTRTTTQSLEGFHV